MAKILEIRVEIADDYSSDEEINTIGEQLQLEMPIFFNDYGIEIGDITFEVKDKLS